MIARNEMAPFAAVKLLARDESVYVRHMVACRKGLTQDILQLLAADDDIFIRRQAQERLHVVA